MEAELIQENVIDWLRNEARKPWSFSIPYEYNGAVQPMFPDFLVIRKQVDALIVDILEPHGSALADSWAKAVGLAKFASNHGDRVRRIELIRVEGSHIKRLDVNDSQNRQKVLAVNSNQHLDQLFADL